MADENLDQITTSWSLLEDAHAGPADRVTAARQLLIERYAGAVRRYLLAVLRDPDAADDLTQDFALSVLRGVFHRADPFRGRFRTYVKTALVHLIARHRKRKRQMPVPLEFGVPEPAAAGDDRDRRFDRAWRDHLLDRTWAALAAARPRWHAALRFRAENHGLNSTQTADILGREFGRPMTADALRQLLHRARARFVELLRDAVAHSLARPTPEAIDDELQALDLLEFCKPARQAT
jgi:RNA polymerase sigma-70 factor (ECF subfamily)